MYSIDLILATYSNKKGTFENGYISCVRTSCMVQSTSTDIPIAAGCFFTIYIIRFSNAIQCMHFYASTATLCFNCSKKSYRNSNLNRLMYKFELMNTRIILYGHSPNSVKFSYGLNPNPDFMVRIRSLQIWS